MAGYRCYLMTGENIYGVQTLEGADDAEVVAKAAALLQSKPEHQSIEVWDGKRMVARVPRAESDTIAPAAISRDSIQRAD
jgi:hypothetical protein